MFEGSAPFCGTTKQRFGFLIRRATGRIEGRSFLWDAAADSPEVAKAQGRTGMKTRPVRHREEEADERGEEAAAGEEPSGPPRTATNRWGRATAEKSPALQQT